MSTVTTPCEESPEDWFIERDGKQYRDDLLVDLDDVLTRGRAENPEAADHEIVDKAEAEAKRAALIRRRKARDACHFECPVRLRCLALGMQEENLDHGTWGGYYAEERQQIQALIEEREKRGQE